MLQYCNFSSVDVSTEHTYVAVPPVPRASQSASFSTCWNLRICIVCALVMKCSAEVSCTGCTRWRWFVGSCGAMRRRFGFDAKVLCFLLPLWMYGSGSSHASAWTIDVVGLHVVGSGRRLTVKRLFVTARKVSWPSFLPPFYCDHVVFSRWSEVLLTVCNVSECLRH